jgi:hypothetical protein
VRAPGLLLRRRLTTRSGENRIPTETFLLPGQEKFCVQPWEIADLPKPQVHVRPPPPPPEAGNTLDAALLEADPCAGWELGSCQIIRRLSPGSVRSLLATRDDPREGLALVVLRQIDLPDISADEIETHAKWAARFRHPFLGRVYNCEISDEGTFWVSERTSGATIAELTAACKKSGKGLPVGLVLSAIHEAAMGLGDLHVPNGFAHGLISDQSIAISFDGTTRLHDVGMFRCIARQSSWGEVMEAVGPYLAPEQVLDGHAADPKCDVYSLAAVLYECLSGLKLARVSNFDERVKTHLSNSAFVAPSSLNVSLGKQLDEVVAKALSPHRAQRYATAIEFANALKAATSGFMWRCELRAEFIGKLFETRKRREQVLLEGCAPRRRLTAPSLPAVATLPPPLPPAPVRMPVAVTGASAPRPASPVALARAPRPSVRPLAMTLIAAAMAWVAWGGVVPTDLDAIESVGAQLGLIEKPAAVIAVPAPALRLAADPVVQEECAEKSTAPLLASLEPQQEQQPLPAGRVMAKASKAVRAAKRKRAADDLPAAPWLAAPKSRRNR